jgi:hypothetical protein
MMTVMIVTASIIMQQQSSRNALRGDISAQVFKSSLLIEKRNLLIINLRFMAKFTIA